MLPIRTMRMHSKHCVDNERDANERAQPTKTDNNYGRSQRLFFCGFVCTAVETKRRNDWAVRYVYTNNALTYSNPTETQTANAMIFATLRRTQAAIMAISKIRATYVMQTPKTKENSKKYNVYMAEM